MPEESKKSHEKKKNDPKEQRKPRHSRNHAGKGEKRVEESRSAPKVIVPQKPPVYEDPGPEFYKNLKRETEEILKITEEENSKYKKKEIQSNWSKYEMPIESYEEIDEQDVGADYEKLIQAPLSIGGHFQFKHEKSWDVNTGPSLYDKYFDINMDNLSLAVSTIPFYERNGVDQSLFSESDMLSMNNRAIKYKQKYYNDKSYATIEMEAQDRIINSLKESISNNQLTETEKVETDSIDKEKDNIEDNRSAQKDDIILDCNSPTKTDCDPNSVHSNNQVEENVNMTKPINIIVPNDELIDDIDDLLENVPEMKPPVSCDQVIIKQLDKQSHEKINTKINAATDHPKVNKESNDLPRNAPASNSTEIKPATIPKENAMETMKNPIIESPEDLEKWLDDFLDG